VVTAVREDVRIHFAGGDGGAPERDEVIDDVVEIHQRGAVAYRLVRTTTFMMSDEELGAFTGAYGGDAVAFEFDVTVVDGALRLNAPDQPPMLLRPIATDRFRVEGPDVPPGAAVVFEMEEGRATALVFLVAGQPPLLRVERR
jgi:hypothetical protein